MTYNISDAAGNAAVEVKRTVNVVDTTPPLITLVGDNPQVIESPSPYVELGATATDACDKNLGAIQIEASGVDTSSLGNYVVTYNISDASGNAAVEVVRTVNVVDTTAPVIVLNGASEVRLECNVDTYSESGATVTDAGDSAVSIVIGGDTVDISTLGTYLVTYDATDSSGNVASQLIRTIVVEDTTPPAITLLGDSPGIIECPDPYQEQGATAADLYEGNLSAQIVIDASEVNVFVPGVYQVFYSVSDESGNEATEARDVEVVDTTVPVIELNGEASIVLLQGDPYVELGAVASDTCDEDVTVVIGGDVIDTSGLGQFVVTYDATDSSGNVAMQVTRTVSVLPWFAALGVLYGCSELKAEKRSEVYGSLGSAKKVDLQSDSLVTGNVANVTGKVDLKARALVNGGVDAGGQVTLQQKAVVRGSVISAVKIDLKKKAIIEGNATSGGKVKLAKDANVEGTITEDVEIVPLADVPLPVLDLITSGSNITVNKNKSVSLVPGEYKNLRGKVNSTISFESGNYSFRNINVDKGSVIELNLSDGPILVSVVKDIDFEGVQMVLIGGTAADVFFQVQGNKVKLGTVSTGANSGSSDDDDGGGGTENNNYLGSYVGTYLVPNGQIVLEE